MYYHDIKHEDMLNGDGLRAVLFVSGCPHHCPGCQNPKTWDPHSGIPFDEAAEQEIYKELDKTYVAGLTLSGGDPLYAGNLDDVLALCRKIRGRYGHSKTIWIYSGYTLDECRESDKRMEILSICDVMCEGRFERDKLSPNKPWVGSENQNVIKLNTLVPV